MLRFWPWKSHATRQRVDWKIVSYSGPAAFPNQLLKTQNNKQSSLPKSNNVCIFCASYLSLNPEASCSAPLPLPPPHFPKLVPSATYLWGHQKIFLNGTFSLQFASQRSPQPPRQWATISRGSHGLQGDGGEELGHVVHQLGEGWPGWCHQRSVLHWCPWKRYHPLSLPQSCQGSPKNQHSSQPYKIKQTAEFLKEWEKKEQCIHEHVL